MQPTNVELVDSVEKAELIEKDIMLKHAKNRVKGGDWSVPRRSRIEGNEINAAERKKSYEQLETKD